jgi:hypothetical protein
MLVLYFGGYLFRKARQNEIVAADSALTYIANFGTLEPVSNPRCSGLPQKSVGGSSAPRSAGILRSSRNPSS